MFSILMQVLYNFILSLGFHSQDKYLPRNRKGYESFHGMIDPTAIFLTWPVDWLDRASLDCPSSPAKAKVGCCKSCDLFSWQVTDCSATRIPSSSITGRHPQSTGSLVVCFFTPLQNCSRRILQSQPSGQCSS